MLPDRVLNPGPLTYESGALPIALRSPASIGDMTYVREVTKLTQFAYFLSLFDLVSLLSKQYNAFKA